MTFSKQRYRHLAKLNPVVTLFVILGPAIEDLKILPGVRGERKRERCKQQLPVLYWQTLFPTRAWTVDFNRRNAVHILFVAVVVNTFANERPLCGDIIDRGVQIQRV